MSVCVPVDLIVMSSTLAPFLSGTQLVVFDKDGTLAHCDKCYGPWCESVVAKLQKLGFITDTVALFRSLDYDPATRRFGVNASIVHGTPVQVMDDCAKEAFKQVGTADDSFDVFRDDFLEKCSRGSEGDIWYVDAQFLTTETLEPCGERMLELFGLLRKAGVKVAVFTSDVRYVTAQTMRTFQLDSFLNIIEKDGVVEDHMACGSDTDIARKPSPDGILKMARVQNASPEHTVMVGDSFVDMIAGLRAGCKQLIFVESGGHTGAELSAFIESPQFSEIAESHGLGEVDVVLEMPETAGAMGAEKRKIYVMKSIDEMLC